MTTLKQSVARNLMLKLFLASDHLTGATGKTLTVTLSKNGAAFAAAAATVTERTSGWYQVALTTADTNTFGDLVIRATATACDDAERLVEVVAFDPQSATNLGLSNLDAVSSTLATAAALNIVDDFLDTEVAAIKAKTDLIPASPTAVGDLATLATAAALTIVDDFLDTEVAAIKAKTDLIPAAPAAVGDLATLATAAALATVAGYVDTEVAAIKAKTDLIPAAPAAVGDIPTATQNADALLTRDWTSVTGAAARSALNALRAIRNKVSRSGATLTVTAEDDLTPSWTATLTTDAAAAPIASVDPS